MSDARVLALQVATVVATAALGVGLLGRIAAWVPAVGVLLAAYAGVTRRQEVSRAEIQRLARRSGLLFAGVGAAAYVGGWSLFPSAFEFGVDGLLVVAPTLGLGVGFAAFVLTLCGADLASSRRAP